MNSANGFRAAALIGLWLVPMAWGAELSLAVSRAPADDTRIEAVVFLKSAPGEDVSGLQFECDFPGLNAMLETVEIGEAAAGAAKAVNFNRISRGRVRAIVAGLNQNVVPDGPVARLRFRVEHGAGLDGAAPFTLSKVVLSDPFGSRIPATVGIVGKEPAPDGRVTSGPNAKSRTEYWLPAVVALGAAALALAGLLYRRARQAG